MFSLIGDYVDGTLHLFDPEEARNPRTIEHGQQVKKSAFVITALAVAAIGAWLIISGFVNQTGITATIYRTTGVVVLTLLAFAIFDYMASSSPKSKNKEEEDKKIVPTTS